MERGFNKPRLAKEKECTGCMACIQSCPVHCISAATADDGFAYPQIDSSRCVNCGRCAEVCPANGTVQDVKEPAAYAATVYNDSLRRSSSSGGVFSLLARKAIAAGGAVFGAAFTKDFSVKHISVLTDEGLAALRGSKYLQSDTSNAYIEAKKLIDSGKTVLFSGTPCQIAGLYAFLGERPEALTCLEVVCHSVPSPAVWRHYLRLICVGDKPYTVSFRNKANGWEDYALTVITEDGKTIHSAGKTDPYIRAFIGGLCSRRSCYRCKFRSGKSGADITLADCWGVKYYSPAAYNADGVSLVLTNTEKGGKLFSSVQDDCAVTKLDYAHAVAANPAVFRSSYPTRRRKAFIKAYAATDSVEEFKRLYESLSVESAAEKLASKLKYKIKRVI